MLINVMLTNKKTCNFTLTAINRLRVAYNDAYKILHGLPRYFSASDIQVQYGIDTLFALLRKNT